MHYKPEELELKVTKVEWKISYEGWVKYNTDGASRGNPRVSSYAFYLRDDKGDLMYARGLRLLILQIQKQKLMLFFKQ